MQGSVSELNENLMFLVLVPASIHSAPTTRWGKAFRAYGLLIVAGLFKKSIMRTYRIHNQICTQRVMASRVPSQGFNRAEKYAMQCD